MLVAAFSTAVIDGAWAKAALTAKTRYATIGLTPDEIAAHVTVYPKDHHLPRSLLHQDWRTEQTYNTPPCLTFGRVHCDAFVADMNGDGRNEYLFVWGSDSNWRGAFLGQDDNGLWPVIGTPSYLHCKAGLDGRRAGRYAVVAPDPRKGRALEAGNSRFRVDPVEQATACP